MKHPVDTRGDPV